MYFLFLFFFLSLRFGQFFLLFQMLQLLPDGLLQPPTAWSQPAAIAASNLERRKIIQMPKMRGSLSLKLVVRIGLDLKAWAGDKRQHLPFNYYDLSLYFWMLELRKSILFWCILKQQKRYFWWYFSLLLLFPDPMTLRHCSQNGND